MKTEKNTAWLHEKTFAHRGLHNNKDVPENSTLAFEHAIQHGYGVEFDVYLTLDGKLIVHHDPTLKRTCGTSQRVITIDTSHIDNYKLMQTDQSIPFFEDILKLVDGKINLIIEIKTTSRVSETCEAIYAVVKNYKGNYCIESFDISVVNWWAKNHPEIILGQLYSENPFVGVWTKLRRQYKKIDFLAVCIKSVPCRYFDKIHKNCPEKIFVTWTVRTPQQLETARKYCDNFIFETNDKAPANIAPPPVDNK